MRGMGLAEERIFQGNGTWVPVINLPPLITLKGGYECNPFVGLGFCESRQLQKEGSMTHRE